MKTTCPLCFTKFPLGAEPRCPQCGTWCGNGASQSSPSAPPYNHPKTNNERPTMSSAIGSYRPSTTPSAPPAGTPQPPEQPITSGYQSYNPTIHLESTTPTKNGIPTGVKALLIVSLILVVLSLILVPLIIRFTTAQDRTRSEYIGSQSSTAEKHQSEEPKRSTRKLS